MSAMTVICEEFPNSGLTVGVWVQTFQVDASGNATVMPVRLEAGMGFGLDQSGVPDVPSAGAGDVTSATLDSALATHRVLKEGSGSHIAAKAAGTYALSNGGPLAVSGTGTLYPQALICIDEANFPTVNGKAPKLRIVATLATNNVAPTGNYTFGLFPVTRPASSGGAGLLIYTLGTVVSGSNGASWLIPAADLLEVKTSQDFDVPASGFYVLGVVTTATVATSSLVHCYSQLQMRNV